MQSVAFLFLSNHLHFLSAAGKVSTAHSQQSLHFVFRSPVQRYSPSLLAMRSDLDNSSIEVAAAAPINSFTEDGIISRTRNDIYEVIVRATDAALSTSAVDKVATESVVKGKDSSIFIDTSDACDRSSDSPNYRYERFVPAYFQDFKTHAKGRWLGREVVEVLSREFGAHPPQYWSNAVTNGKVRINERIVSPDYCFRNSDRLLHRTHRHEAPVFGRISFVGETTELFAICKPASLPMHPCGAYRYNSLEYILKHDLASIHDYKGISSSSSSSGDSSGGGSCGSLSAVDLHVVHRLDRVTSGLVVMAKSKAVAQRVSEEIRDKNITQKLYLARVRGKFPSSQSDALQQAALTHLRDSSVIMHTINASTANSDIDNNNNSNVSWNIDSFFDEVRDYQQSAADNQRAVSQQQAATAVVKRSFADIATAADRQSNASKRSKGTAVSVATADIDARSAVAAAEEEGVEDASNLPPIMEDSLSFEEVGKSANVGYAFAPSRSNSGSSSSISSSNKSALQAALDRLEAVLAAPIAAEELWVKCPIRVLCHRDGIHACHPLGKPSLSAFRLLGYCAESDTSLVQCLPVTGRTHQLRLHLQLLGYPIANDPCYGGKLFYGDNARREKAVQALREMRLLGIQPLSKVPHFEEAEEGGEETSSSSSNSSSSVEGTVYDSQKPGESDDEFLIRTCRYCQESRSEQLEQLLHCEGIYLHSLSYSGSDWSFTAPLPEWSAPFLRH